MIRVLIVDDERPARDGLRLRLAKAEGFELVGEAGSGRAAIAAILRHEPDLVLLDIRMPDMNGFEVLRRVPPAQRPRVIFVTAFDRHALEAFEIHALDYLLKPIVARRFAAALEHARDSHQQQLASRTLDELASGMRNAGPSEPGRGVRPPLDRLTVREGTRLKIVPVETIRWIEACGNYVTLHAGGRGVLHRMTLSQLERQLPRRTFARIHRGTIVNVSEIAEIRLSLRGDGDVVLRDGTTLRLSRRYRASLE